MKKLFLMLVAGCMAAGFLRALPAPKDPIVLEQSDGTSITVYLRGDENLHWIESEDGYTLIRLDGQCYYAVKAKDGNLVASDMPAHAAALRTEEEKVFLQGIPKGLFYSESQLEPVRKSVQKEDARRKEALEKFSSRMKASRAKGETLTMKTPIILVNFSDRVMTTQRASFDSLITMEGYKAHGCAGSFLDYFLANSRGTFRFEADVYGPITLENSIKYYGDDASGLQGKAPEMVKDACDILSREQGVDFSKYDNDGDGVIDAVHIVFAGKGQESTYEANAIWSHKSNVTGNTSYNGKKLDTYACSAEISNWGDYAFLSGIVHENSHILGLPDFYDTDGSNNGTAVTLGAFDVMDDGAYNNHGKTLPLHNVWSRAQAGWLETVYLEDTCTVELKPAEEATIAYMVKTPEEGEYFALDYRGPESVWDTAIPGYGMLIFAVNENVGNWEENQVNISSIKRGFYIKQANGGGNSNSPMSDKTPFPGSTNKTEFTDDTRPSSQSSTGKKTGKPIYGIAEMEEGGVSFLFMGEGDSVYDNQGNAYPTGNGNPETAVEESAQAGFVQVYPNPAADALNVRASAEMEEICVFDLNGRRVRRAEAFGAVQADMDISGLRDGVYLVQVRMRDGGLYRSKIVKGR